MRKILITFIITSFIAPAALAQTANELTQRLSGRILLQVESYGRAWYVDPISLERYYLSDGNEAYYLMRTKGLGITNADLEKIPTRAGQAGDRALVNRLRGRILLQVQENGEAWYVDPVTGLRSYMRDGQAAYDLMRDRGLGISNDDLRQITMNDTQIVHDTTFDDVAYVGYNGQNFFGGYNNQQILPLASLSKLMTALVLSDLGLQWNKQIIINQNQLDYPKTLVGEDATSEVDLAVDDVMTVYDLWIAMLVASSNQAAVALVDATNLTRAEFVNLMNQKAQQLGLTKTKFYDVAGLDAHNVTTAEEMAKMAFTAFNNTDIYNALRQKNYIINAIDQYSDLKQIKVVDRNYSLQAFGAEAAKTGYLIEAQRTVALIKNNKVIVVLHALSMTQRNQTIEKLLAL